jgi:hypothetical protein
MATDKNGEPIPIDDKMKRLTGELLLCLSVLMNWKMKFAHAYVCLVLKFNVYALN